MYDKIVNPNTGRRVSIYGQIGREILKNYLNQLGGGLPDDSLQLTIIFTDPDDTSNKIRHKEVVNGVPSRTKFIKPLGWIPTTIIEYNTDGEMTKEDNTKWYISWTPIKGINNSELSGNIINSKVEFISNKIGEKDGEINSMATKPNFENTSTLTLPDESVLNYKISFYIAEPHKCSDQE